MTAARTRLNLSNGASKLGATFRRVWLALGSALSAGLASAVAAGLFFAWLAEEVLEGDTRAFDDAARTLVQVHASPALTAAMRLITALGSTSFMVALGVCVAAGFLYAGWRRGVVLFAATMAGAIILNWSLKLAFHRARPTPFFDMPVPSSFSFPSGHALLSFCFYGALASIIAARTERAAARLTIWLGAGLLVAGIGLSRVYLGVHYASDVAAGYAAALVWVVAVALGDHRIRHNRRAAE